MGRRVAGTAPVWAVADGDPTAPVVRWPLAADCSREVTLSNIFLMNSKISFIAEYGANSRIVWPIEFIDTEYMHQTMPLVILFTIKSYTVIEINKYLENLLIKQLVPADRLGIERLFRMPNFVPIGSGEAVQSTVICNVKIKILPFLNPYVMSLNRYFYSVL